MGQKGIKPLSGTQETLKLFGEVTRFLAEMPRTLDRITTSEAWDAIAGVKSDSTDESQKYLIDYIKRVKAYNGRLENLMATNPTELARKELDVLRRIDESLDPLIEIYDENDADACNTDCSAYAQGTCEYIEAARLSKAAEAMGLRDKRTCPRYRKIYPERV